MRMLYPMVNMMDKITRTTFAYLCGAVAVEGARAINEYIGSFPNKSGERGPFSNEFRYKLNLVVEEKIPLKVVASCYFGNLSFGCTDSSLITVKEFEASQEGVDAAFEWLESEYDKS